MENKYSNKSINYQKGIWMMMISSIFSSVVGLLVKYLTNIPLMEIVLFRNLPSVIILPIIITKKHIPLLGENKPLLIIRSLLAFTSFTGYVYTFTKMSLTDAITIRQLGPIIIALLSIILLKEKYTSKKLIVFITAFIGATFIVKPGIRSDVVPVFIGIITTFIFGFSHVFVRKLNITDHPLVIVNYFMFFSGIISAFMLYIGKDFIFPDLLNLSILVLLGFISLGVQIPLTKAYQYCPASLVSIYMYSQIVFGSFFDIFFLKQFLDLLSITGVVLIIFSGYQNYQFSRFHA